MDKSLIIILAVILFILMLLNNLNMGTTRMFYENQGDCRETTYGCCPDGVNSKINFYGTNCPNYNPGAGYPHPVYKPHPVIVTHR